MSFNLKIHPLIRLMILKLTVWIRNYSFNKATWFHLEAACDSVDFEIDMIFIDTVYANIHFEYM